MSLLKSFKSSFKSTEKDLTITQFLNLCKKDSSVYSSPAERMLKAIGEPELVSTKDDPRLSRIHSNKVIKRYPSFSDFYGMEDTIEQIVSFFKHAAQGLEEKKQVLYLLGPVGGGKSSLAERLKQLMENNYVYVLVANGEINICKKGTPLVILTILSYTSLYLISIVKKATVLPCKNLLTAIFTLIIDFPLPLLPPSITSS